MTEIFLETLWVRGVTGSMVRRNIGLVKKP